MSTVSLSYILNIRVPNSHKMLKFAIEPLWIYESIRKRNGRRKRLEGIQLSSQMFVGLSVWMEDFNSHFHPRHQTDQRWTHFESTANQCWLQTPMSASKKKKKQKWYIYSVLYRGWQQCPEILHPKLKALIKLYWVNHNGIAFPPQKC